MVSWLDQPTFDGPWQDEVADEAAREERDREALETLDELEPEDAWPE